MFRLLICLGLTAVLASAAPVENRGVELTLQGHCPEAMPLLDQGMRDTSAATDSKRTIAFAGVRCSMLLKQQGDAMSFLSWLQQAYPQDPDVLFLAVHVFSELSARNSEQLLKTAPDSPLVVQLNAENFEKQGELAKAVAEYRILLQRTPDKPGVHYRIGGLLMEQPGNAVNEEARKEFEAELKINAQNAGAEYYLGEIDRKSNKLSGAIEHYSRAAKLYPGFAEAQFGLGRALLDSEKAAEAVGPLETAEKLSPENPTVHLALATAYQRTGRKQDAAKEFALQKSTSEKLNQTTKILKKNVSGVPLEAAPQ